ncbi:MAG: N-6 DNA methylase [Candidatus Helarchaeota archaeon]
MKYLKDIFHLLKKNLVITEDHINLIKDYMYPYLEIKKDSNKKPEIRKLIAFEIILHLLIYQIYSIFDENIKDLSSIDDFQKYIDKLLQQNDFIKKYFNSEILKLMSDQRNQELIKQTLSYIKKINISNLMELKNIDIFFQEILSNSARKRYAVNYTNNNIARLLVLLSLKKTDLKIIDPFVGSGRLLIEAFKQILLSKKEDFDLTYLYGLDILFPAIQLTFINILSTILKLFPNKKIFKNIQLIKEDAFKYFQFGLKSYFNPPIKKYLHTFDLVIMNPPFTRYTRLEKDYRQLLNSSFQEYSKFIGKQLGLHGYALFLADKLLNNTGTIAAVLPASTFYSEYSQGIQEFFLKNYQIKYIISSQVSKSFSDGSDFREILFICQKKNNTQCEKNPMVKFVSLKSDIDSTDINKVFKLIKNSESDIDSKELKLKLISYEQLSNPENWNIFLNFNELNKIFLKIKEKNVLITGNDLNFDIIRGFEMYGPEFFFFPNKYWEIIEDKEKYIKILNKKSKKELKINKKFVNRALRQPKLYKNEISPKVHNYILNIPSNLQFSEESDILEYLKWGENIDIPAKKRFGKNWFSHINNQFRSKNPIGKTFVIDKFSITSVALLSHFFEDNISASKNFYIFKGPNLDSEKFLSAWLNSSIFIALFLLFRREIGGSYGRLQIVDYFNYPLFIKYDRKNKFLNDILESFDRLRKLKLPPFTDQFSFKERNDLDYFILRYIGFNESDALSFRHQLYDIIKQEFKNLQIRDNKNLKE